MKEWKNVRNIKCYETMLKWKGWCGVWEDHGIQNPGKKRPQGLISVLGPERESSISYISWLAQ